MFIDIFLYRAIIFEIFIAIIVNIFILGSATTFRTDVTYCFHLQVLKLEVLSSFEMLLPMIQATQLQHEVVFSYHLHM
jgi:hypothetical protein